MLRCNISGAVYKVFMVLIGVA